MARVRILALHGDGTSEGQGLGLHRDDTSVVRVRGLGLCSDDTSVAGVRGLGLCRDVHLS